MTSESQPAYNHVTQVIVQNKEVKYRFGNRNKTSSEMPHKVLYDHIKSDLTIGVNL